MGSFVGESNDGERESNIAWSRLSFFQKVTTFALFMCMGSGANWVFPNSLSQEIPYFENHLPEKLCIATYMNATTHCGVIFMLTFVYVHYYVRPIPHHISVPTLLLGSTIGCFLASAVYPITENGVSFMLYICCAIGGGVGSLSSVIMNPFMTSYQNIYISAGRGGGSGLILTCAVIAFIQAPGSNQERFSTSIYLIIFGSILTLPIFAYRYIIANQIGLRAINNNSGNIDNVINESGENPMLHPSVDKTPEEQAKMVDRFNIVAPSKTFEFYTKIPAWSTPFDVKFHQFIDLCVPKSYEEAYPWLKRAIPYMMAVGWVNFNTFGITAAVIPFAIADGSTTGDGSQYLGIAYPVAAFALAFGDLSTAVFKLPLFYALIAFTALSATIYTAAGTTQGFQNAAAAPILIAVYAVQRFLEAHIVTSTYRAIATHFAPEHKELASRSVGIADQVSTAAGALLSTMVVALTFNCDSNDDDDGSSRRFL
jgi:hypothetical protein